MLLEDELNVFLQIRQRTKESKVDMVNKILLIIKNYNPDENNNALVDLNNFLLKHEVLTPNDISSSWYKEFNNILNEVRNKMGNDEKVNRTCGHCLHCDIVGHCAIGTYAFTKPEWLKNCSKIEVGTHEQLHGKNMYYFGDLKKGPI